MRLTEEELKTVAHLFLFFSSDRNIAGKVFVLPFLDIMDLFVSKKDLERLKKTIGRDGSQRDSKKRALPSSSFLKKDRRAPKSIVHSVDTDPASAPPPLSDSALMMPPPRAISSLVQYRRPVTSHRSADRPVESNNWPTAQAPRYRPIGGETPPVCEPTPTTSEGFAIELSDVRDTKHDDMILTLLYHELISNEDIFIIVNKAMHKLVDVASRLLAESDSLRHEPRNVDSVNPLYESSSTASTAFPAQDSLMSSVVFHFKDWRVSKTTDGSKGLRIAGKLYYPGSDVLHKNWFRTSSIVHYDKINNLITTAAETCKFQVIGRCSNYEELPRGVRQYFVEGFPKDWQLIARMWHSVKP